MCSIFALYRPDADAASLTADLHAMARNLAHRGPDATGVVPITRADATTRACVPTCWTGPDRSRFGDEAVLPPVAAGFLGHHRLAILDLDRRSAQPLADAARDVSLAMNGEIYNYLELRRELDGLGHRFRTHGDGEVALRAYLQWGEGCLERFVGDFAIVVVDHRHRALLAARDRFGAKPLFVWQRPGIVAITSELKGMLDLDGFRPRLDQEVAVRYLVADFPTEQTLGRSFLEDVTPVPAGCWRRWTLGARDASEPVTRRYWCLDAAVAAEPRAWRHRDVRDRFDALLEDAVRLRLRSDVPVGGLLSGGLDSPSVLWHAVRHAGPLPTFSVTFPGLEDDESDSIATVASHLGVPNECLAVDMAIDATRLRDAVVEQDEPFTTLNVVCQSSLLRLAASRGVRVILDGGAADEVLGGYADYMVPAAADAAGRDGARAGSDEVRRFIASSPQQLMRRAAADGRRCVAYLTAEARRVGGLDVDGVDRPLDPRYKGSWRGSYLRHALRRSAVAAWMNKSVEWDARSLDRAGMRWAVEARCPFMDHRVVTAALAASPGDLVRGRRTKLLLRRSMRGRLPEAIRRNPRKIGFRVPFCELLRRGGPLRDALRELAGDRTLETHGLVDAAAVRRELALIEAGRSANYNLWRVFNLQLWSRAYLRRDARVAAHPA